MKVADVIKCLTGPQKKRLARQRGRTIGREVTPDGLAASYKGDWVSLLKDMTNPEVTRALCQLLKDKDDELRVVALRTFAGRSTELDEINWDANGEARRRRQAIRIVKALCGFVPQALQADTWKDEIEPRLRDVGIESLDPATGGKTLIKLRRIFVSR